MFFSSQIISTGNGSSVVLYNGSLDGDSYQFDVDQVDCIRGVACYHRDKHYVAIATDKHTVVEYSYASGNPMDDPYAEVHHVHHCIVYVLYVYCMCIVFFVLDYHCIVLNYYFPSI